MKSLIASLVATTVQGAEHFVAGFPTLWVTHVKDASVCDDMNMKVYTFRGIKDLYYFDQKSCTCMFDFVKLEGKIQGHYFKDSVPSPLVPGESYLQCQIDEIYKHDLGDDCSAPVNELPYDYTETMKLHFGFDHEHGEPNTGHYDEHGHFGAIEDCEGRVIHYADNTVVLPPQLRKEIEVAPQLTKK